MNCGNTNEMKMWPSEHCSEKAEATGSNPVEAPKIFFRAVVLAIAITTAMVTSLFHLRVLSQSRIFVSEEDFFLDVARCSVGNN